MGTAYVDITIEAKDGPYVLFQADCTAEVEYEIDAGALAGWHVRDLRFDHHAYRYSPDQRGAVRVKVAETWAKDHDNLLKLLLPYINRTQIEDPLLDQLTATGELVMSAAAQCAHHQVRVL